MFLAFCRGHFWVSQWLSQNDYLGCMGQNGHCHILASGGSFLWFKVVSSCLLVCSDIPDGSYVSIMSHCDVTLVLEKMANMKIRTGFDKSFPRNGLVFVIWRAEYSFLSTLEQFLSQTEQSFWLVSCFVDMVSQLFFLFFDFLVILRSFLCVTVTKCGLQNV